MGLVHDCSLVIESRLLISLQIVTSLYKHSIKKAQVEFSFLFLISLVSADKR